MKFIQGSWLKENAVVIDCGITSVKGFLGFFLCRSFLRGKFLCFFLEENEKSRLYGDVDFGSCQGIASWITPVPGGVGPMTVAKLMLVERRVLFSRIELLFFSMKGKTR